MRHETVSDTLTNNSTISHYRIERKIGAGGMGEVYLAQDTKLDRKVALKILPPEFAEDKDRMSRFVREAKSASALNHPNIITIYEIGESDKTHFIATEFIDGKTLNQYVKSNPLAFKSALEIAIQIASALDEAHSAGIVHRDIKPDNVMVRSNGLVKILDFGIAKLSGANHQPILDAEAATAIQAGTVPGMIIGTANYMSPEQAAGKAVDARSDIFSFGVILYEMIAGRLPFAGETPVEMIGAILYQEPPPLGAGVPEEVKRIVGKCLKKNVRERYQSIKEACEDLKDFKQELDFQEKLERTSAPHPREAETQIFKARTIAEENPKSEIQNLKSIVVLPFTNMSADEENEFFCDGLAEELLNALAKIEDLRVAARTSAFSFKNKSVEAGEIGRALNVKTILEGSVRRSVNRLRITVQLVNASDGYHLWSERYDREMQDIFDVQDEITLAVVDALKVKLLGEEKAALLKRYTNNTEVYELYLKGRYNYNKYSPETWHKAIEYFEKAIAIEPEYAPAFAGIGFCYGALWYFGLLSSEIIPKWRAVIDRALEIDGELADAHLSLASIHFYFDRNWADAERDYLRAIELNPNSADAYWRYGIFLTSREQFEQAVSSGRRALELDPLSLVANYFMGCIYWFADRLDDALEQSRKMIELEPNFALAYLMRGVVLIAKGMYREAVEALQKSVSLSRSPWILSNLGAAYALAGKRDEALAVLNQLLEMRQRQYTSAFSIARVYVELDDLDKTFEWLEKAIEEQNGELVFFKRLTTIGTAWGENFRQDPRYQNILRRIGLPIDENAPGQTTNEVSEAQTVMLSPGELKSEKSDDLAEKKNANAKLNSEISPKSKTQKPKSKWWLFGLLGLLVLVGGFFGSKYLFTPTNKQIESIAVMPFVNESGNAETEYLSDGMTETLINSLSQLPNLSVKARSSVFRYKGKEIDPKKIASELNVQAILNGRVVQRGDGLTLSLELIDAQTENVIWSDAYNRKQADLVSLQSEVARDVSSKLRVKLSGADERKLARNYTENAEAYRLYLQGRFYWNKRNPQDIRKAIGYFNQAIALDPNYTLGYTGLADAYSSLSNYRGAPPHETMPKAKDAALKALSLDNNLAEAHTALAFILHFYDYDFVGAEREYLRAVELNPNYAQTHHLYGILLSNLGRQEEGFARIRHALQIEPLSLIINRTYGERLIFVRRYDDAVAQLKKTIELDAGFMSARYSLAAAYQMKGSYAECVEELAKYQEQIGEPQTAAQMRESYAKNGWQGFLRMVTEKRLRFNSPWETLATVYAALGEKDRAFAELNKSYENRENIMTLIKVDPRFDPLRDDPRFEELLRKVGFP